MKKVLIIDNYDSFVYNLVHYLKELGCETVVKRNDQVSIEEVGDYEKILLSPGPGLPDEAGLLKEIISTYALSKSILGVCLGQQAIGEVFGARLINLKAPYHGIATSIFQNEKDRVLFKGLSKEVTVGRYHSWIVENDLPDCLEATSFDDSGNIMSIQHKNLDIRGVQFHPESVLTPEGKKILQNWIS